MFKLELEKAEEPEIKLPTSTGSSKKEESSRKTSISAFDCVDHHKLWKILEEMGIPDHLTCLLRNLYADQEATVRTGHGTTDWFQIGKGVFSSVQSLSRIRLCDPMNRMTPGLPVHHHLPEFTRTHIHRVHDAIQPSHPWSSPSPPAPNPSQHQSLFQ